MRLNNLFEIILSPLLILWYVAFDEFLYQRLALLISCHLGYSYPQRVNSSWRISRSTRIHHHIQLSLFLNIHADFSLVFAKLRNDLIWHGIHLLLLSHLLQVLWLLLWHLRCVIHVLILHILIFFIDRLHAHLLRNLQRESYAALFIEVKEWFG
jgi:hypothetical protein